MRLAASEQLAAALVLAGVRRISAKMTRRATSTCCRRTWSGSRDVVEQIEKMKREYTDKYVVVDATRPELARFRDVVGRVKTVNMSGRALVEFDDYHLNIGWYDIDPEFLKVVDKPPPKAPKAEAKKPAAKAEAKPAAAKAPAKQRRSRRPRRGKPSVADILAAARGGKAAAPKPAGETAQGRRPRRDRSRKAGSAGESRSLEDERRRHACRGRAAAERRRKRRRRLNRKRKQRRPKKPKKRPQTAPAAKAGAAPRPQVRRKESTSRRCRSTTCSPGAAQHDAK